MEPRTMQNRFSAILKKERLPSVHFHSLRHAFATRAVEVGFDIKTLSEILGHSSTAVTDKYYLHTINGKKELPNILREAFGSKDSDDESKESK